MVTMTLAAMGRTTQRRARASLQSIVEGLTANSDTALARIWLLQTEHACDICRTQHSEHSNTEIGLHLAASAGHSRNLSQPQTWSRLDGMSHRFPLRSQKIGLIGATGEPLIVRQTSGDASLTNPKWLEQEGIQSFFGYPLADGDRIFGVLGVFLRRELSESDLNYLRQITNLSTRLIVGAIQQDEEQTRIRCLTAENVALRRRSEFDRDWGPPIRLSAASRKWDEQIRLTAQHAAPVLILGERGSGKEYTARRIHTLSKSTCNPFLIVEGRNLDVDFLEQLLTGLRHSSENADSLPDRDVSTGGTLLIESIELAPLETQKWLSEYLNHRSSNDADQTTNRRGLRILADSSADLDDEVASGRMLNELYCALSVAEIRVPPLRTRADDLPRLAKQFVERFCEREHRTMLEIPAQLIKAWERSAWPGNVRELELALTRCLWHANVEDVEIRAVEDTPIAEIELPSEILRDKDLKRNEKANLLACLKQCDWKVYGSGGAAEMLGLKPTTLIYRMKILGIRRPAR